MANVSGPITSHKRGQLIFIGGLSLALTFVALALILNSVIYSENLATRSSATGGQDAARFNEEVEQGVSDLIAQINQNHNTLLSSRLQTVVSDWSEYVTRYYAAEGKAVSVAVEPGSVTTSGENIDSAEVRIVYRGPRTQYEAVIRISP